MMKMKIVMRKTDELLLALYWPCFHGFNRRNVKQTLLLLHLLGKQGMTTLIVIVGSHLVDRLLPCLFMSPCLSLLP